MRNKVLFLIMLFAGMFFTINVSALEEPELVEIDGEKLLFANGTEIIISATDNGQGAVVSYGDGKSITIPSDVYVFGGSHNNETKMTTSITMNGGKILGIIGGGLHKSHVTSATIVFNDGQVGQIDGGGVASIFFDSPGTEEKTHVYDGSAIDSTTRVDEVFITINGGKIEKLTGSYGLLFGGGMGYSYTGSVELTINGGDLSTTYVTAGGSNGYTNSSIVSVTGGEIGMLQGINRGSMSSAKMNISGGNIEEVYVAGSGDSGTISNAIVEIIGGNIENVYAGTNGTDSSGKDIPASNVAYLHYNSGAVKNVDESEFKSDFVIKTVTLTIKTSTGASVNIEVPVGTIYSTDDVNELKKTIVKDLIGNNSLFDGFYNSDTYTDEYDFSKVIDQNTTVYVKVVQKREQNITNPETSDLNVLASIVMIVAGSLGLGYIVKKRKFN